MVNVHPPRPAILFILLLLAAGLTLSACPSPPPPPTAPPLAVTPEIRWKINLSRGQSAYLKLDLPVIMSGSKITLHPAPLPPPPTLPITNSLPRQPLWNGSITLFSSRIIRGPVEGPTVEQLTAQPRLSTDAGTYLVPLAVQADGAAQVFTVTEPMPLYARITIPPALAPGEYEVVVQIAAPGRAVEEDVLVIEVADIAIPTEPRILAVATTTVDELARIYPDTFGKIAGQYLNPADVDHKAAAAQLDSLIKTARAQGISLFVEDIIPTTRVDEMGQVALDWDAYDRLMQPYMDGTAFEDRVSLPVWLAPVPPRRIRDSSTQLWQYIDACAKHYAAKGWVAVPAFLHPAVGGSEGVDATTPAELEKLRAQVSEMMRLHMPREMLAVATPGADVPHGQLWTVNDEDTRLPPAGALASEYSVRVWPWVCVARGNMSGAGGAGGSPTGVKGLVWRDAVCGADALAGHPTRPLLVVQNKTVSPTLRMVWLNEGLNDAALLGLLEKRADVTRAGMISEILAGMVGRTGAEDKTQNAKSKTQNAGATGAATQPNNGGADDIPLSPTGYLYAGWPAEREVWGQVTGNLQKLILATAPGTRAAMKPDDPAYLAARLWLAGTRRPVARIAGYDFSQRAAVRGGGILDARMHVLVENPVAEAAEIDLRFNGLPGDFDMAPVGTDAAARRNGDTATSGPSPLAGGIRSTTADEGVGATPPPLRRRTISLAASSVADITLPLAGHVEQLMGNPTMEALELTERFNGAVLRLPVRLPLYRMHRLEAGQNPPKMDGLADDWPMDNQTQVFGEMKAGTRYLARPDLLAGVVRADEKAASVRWTYDAEYLYMLARCPQDSISDDRNTEWPVQRGAGGVRWWGTDGLQVELAPMKNGQWTMDNEPVGERGVLGRVVKVAFKPAGVVLVQTGQVVRDGTGVLGVTWKDGPPAGAVAGIKYGISIQREGGRVVGYTVEAAVPRAWVEGETQNAKLQTQNDGGVAGANVPAWRVNVLRHRAGELVSASWSGPVVEDDDVGMMGAMMGE